MNQKAFEGLKVVDFTQGLSGTVAPRLLADFGAIVVHVESMKRVDITRVSPPFKDNVPGVNRSLFFPYFQANKYGITLNMDHHRAKEVAERLIAWADVFTDNRVGSVLEKWGLGYDDVIKIKPDIIMMRVTTQGTRGPLASERGYGPNVAAQAGFVNALGWPDRDPTIRDVGLYADLVAARLASVALLAALHYRRRTGKGQLLDISMVETGISFLPPQVLDYYVNDRDLSRMGNRCSHAAPHGAYPCRGNDVWCVIGIFGDGEWKSLCKAIGEPTWASQQKFATLSGRKENEDELDGLISEWTSKLPPEEVMIRLQGAGVHAGVVRRTIPELRGDPQLQYRQHFWALDHAEIGLHDVDSWSFRLSKTQPDCHKAAPCLGEDNEYVYTRILGMSDEEFINLLSDGVFE